MIEYRRDVALTAEQLRDIFLRARLKRPTDDLERIGRMNANANLSITAWEGDELVGVARSLTDFAFCCYLSDLAVDRNYQKLGIGKELVRLTQEAAGEESMVLLLSVPDAMEYYPRIGMNPVPNGWILPRAK